MNKLISEKYKPLLLDHYCINNKTKKLINYFLKSNNVKLLIIGNICSGKTIFANILINEYFNNVNNNINNNIINDNLLYISSLKDNGINYFRNEIKIFCQSNNMFNKKKLIVVDDIDCINDQCQYILLGLINKYKNKVNIILTVNNYQKILDSFLSHLTIINLEYPDYEYLYNFTKNIIYKENINITDDLIHKIILNSNHSIKNIFNILEKFILYDNNINNTNINDFLYFINDNIFYEFTMDCINKNIKNAINKLKKIYYNGYSIIDIYDYYSNFIKNTNDFNENIKFEIINILIKYIINYHNTNEHIIELYFFVNTLINRLYQLK